MHKKQRHRIKRNPKWSSEVRVDSLSNTEPIYAVQFQEKILRIRLNVNLRQSNLEQNKR